MFLNRVISLEKELAREPLACVKPTFPAMMDVHSTLITFLGYGTGGLLGGLIVKKLADGLVMLMIAFEANSIEFGRLRKLSRQRREGVRKFRERSAERARRLDEARARQGRAEQAKRAVEIELASLKKRPDNTLRMLGDERNGSKAWAAEVSNASMARGDSEKVGIGRFWPREWIHGALVVVWANSRAEARQKLESTYQHCDGFMISSMHEFSGAMAREQP